MQVSKDGTCPGCGDGVCTPPEDATNCPEDCDLCPNDPNKTDPGLCGCGVPDTTAPTITQCAANETIAADANCQALVPDLTGDVVADANGCGSVTITQDPPEGTTIGAGHTIVTLTATNAAGNTDTCTATITVTSTIAPTITQCAANQTIAPTNCHALVPDLTTQVVADAHGCGTVTVTQNPVAGTSISIGNTIVTLTAKNSAGNTATCTATITVPDTTPPTITTQPPAQSITAGAGCLAAIPNLVAQTQATDACSPPVTITQAPAAGTSVGLGAHPVTVTATDSAGNAAHFTVQITVTSPDSDGDGTPDCAPGATDPGA